MNLSLFIGLILTASFISFSAQLELPDEDLLDSAIDSECNKLYKSLHAPKINFTGINGPEWTIIQQRIDGKEDFYRNWNTYRNGFGSFNGSFFLGLQNIHDLTRCQRHELYIHMEFFNGTTIYARYDNFTVSDEQDNFRLLSVGEHTGTAEDRLYFHVNRGFTTFDKDNNDWVKLNCAEDRHGAWWYGICSISNLNGKYFDAEVYGYRTSIYWEPWIALKTVKMAIRPFPNKINRCTLINIK